MDRRGFLQAILAAGVAPAFAGSGVLMPIQAPLFIEPAIILPSPPIPHGMVRIHIPFECANDTSAVFVWINGRSTHIPRAVNVDVPVAVCDVLSDAVIYRMNNGENKLGYEKRFPGLVIIGGGNGNR